MPEAGAQTLPGLLRAAAGGPGGIRFLRAGGATQISYAALLSRATGLLARLQARGARPGDAVVLFLDHNPAFVDAFWACQLGGLVPVPLTAGAGGEPLRKLEAVAALLEAPLLFTGRELYRAARTAQPVACDAFGNRVLLLEDIASLPDSADLHPAAPGDTALIQFSSGSTSDPKGVVLTHANLLANLDAIIGAARVGAGDVALSWMPLSHDLGLVGSHLMPLAAGLPQTLMDTALFVRRPARWLQAVAEYGATLTCSPDFGYRHWLQHAGGEIPADLSSLRLVFHGAEPVCAETGRAFAAALAPAGFDPRALFPVYGLAEACLAVSFPEPGSGIASLHVARGRLAVGDVVTPVPAGSPDALELAALGRPVPGCELRVTGDDGAVLDADRVGHIEIRGANVTAGYYRNPDADARWRRGGGWLDTGDLGFLHAGRLYVVGRSKDLLFCRGRNHFPHDLEALLVRHAGLPAGKVAVCGARRAAGGAEDILVFVQQRGDPGEFAGTAARVRETLALHAGVRADRVLPVPRLPRTTSGKLQRYRLAQGWTAGEYDGLAARLDAVQAAGAEQAAGEVELTLLEICNRMLPGQAIDRDRNLFELGADSLLLVRIHEEIEAAFPGRVEVTDLFDHPTIASLAGYIEDVTPTSTRVE